MKATFLCVLALSVAQVSQAEVLKVKFDVTSLDGKKGETGSFTMEAHSEWAPLGFARFKEMVESDFYKGVRFFRVIDGFMAQFGIHGKPAIAAEWKEKTLKDDPVIESNKVSYVSFATSGKDSRTTQMFINFSDNANLDGMDFSPFAKVQPTPTLPLPPLPFGPIVYAVGSRQRRRRRRRRRRRAHGAAANARCGTRPHRRPR